MEKVEKHNFDREYNISWVDENLPSATNSIILKHYFCSLAVYGTALLLIWFNPFFSKMLAYPLKLTFNLFYEYYIFIAPIIYFYYRPKSLWRSHNIEIVKYLYRIITHRPQLSNLSIDEIKTQLDFYKPQYYEKQSLILIFIKIFFGCQMIQGVYSNINNLLPNISMFKEIFDINYQQFLYNQSITILFTIDLAIFSFGYLTELGILKNKVRTVETTPAGLFFCLACYPPFFSATNSFLGWNHNTNAAAFSDPNSLITWTFRIIAIFFLIMYVGASMALGSKASNLTNRGTVSSFPYNIVRHPAYISKILFWMFTTIPLFIVHFNGHGFSLKKYLIDVILLIITFVCLTFIYYFRALTEERHLIKDPDYQEYAKKVKYRFIPFVI